MSALRTKMEDGFPLSNSCSNLINPPAVPRGSVSCKYLIGTLYFSLQRSINSVNWSAG